METNKVDEFDFVTRKEVESICVDVSAGMTEMREVINTQAEVLGLCRYLLAAFMPAAQMADAIAKYRAERERQIAAIENAPIADSN